MYYVVVFCQWYHTMRYLLINKLFVLNSLFYSGVAAIVQGVLMTKHPVAFQADFDEYWVFKKTLWISCFRGNQPGYCKNSTLYFSPKGSNLLAHPVLSSRDKYSNVLPPKIAWQLDTIDTYLPCVYTSSSSEPTESGNTGPWLATNHSRDLNSKFLLVVY